ncbi:MAG TPA: LCP family protein [Candidatus Dormibacteraeota bacterium]|nr:LCP family protein [Candidatus Dormibacteraeota bacterium]
MRRRAATVVLLVIGFTAAGLAGAVAYFLPVLATTLGATGQSVVGALTQRSPSDHQPFTVLLLGSDDDAKFVPGHLLTQSMILVRVEPSSGHVTMLSIPRDLYVPISSGGTAKIDTAYADGGAATAIATVEQDFNVHVDHYVWIGLRGLVNLIDRLGGVDVVTTNPVLDDFYPADLAGGNPYGYQRVAVMPGAQHLSGLTAMEYVRSRHDDLREDFGRSERQQQVLLALRTRAHTVGLTDLPDIASALSGEILTDLSLPEVADLLPIASGLQLGNVEHVLLLPPVTSDATVDGQSVLQPDWDRIRERVAQSFP